MSPVLIAFVQVALLFLVFWTTRTSSPGGRKWGVRLACAVVLFILSGALAEDPRAAAVSGEYTVYFGLAAAVLYLIANSLAPARGRS